jgi:hypothetical protein
MFAPHEAIGFLRLVWQGEMAPGVTIVEAAPCGQFDLYFCSIACLRAFMTARIDALETLSKKEERRAAFAELRRIAADRTKGLSPDQLEALRAAAYRRYRRNDPQKKHVARFRAAYGRAKVKRAKSREKAKRSRG